MRINKKAVYVGLFYLCVFIFLGYVYISSYMQELESKKYDALTLKIKENLQSDIKARAKENLLVSYSFSLNKDIKTALLAHNNQKLNFDTQIQALQRYANFHNIWFQVIDDKGVSFYRTWTKDTGDSLIGKRLDVSEMIKNPHTQSSISVGKYVMTFKTMIPIFEEKKFIGMIESIVGFESIVSSMKKRGYEALILVDKKYKQQLSKASPNKFISNYYVTASNKNSTLAKLLEENNIEEYININTYKIDEKNELLLTSYQIKDIHNQSMGYCIISFPLRQIDMSDVYQEFKLLVFIVFFILIFIIIFFYYIYTEQYKRLIDKQKIKLNDKVKARTASLTHMSLHDPLSKLPNRLQLLKILQEEIRKAKESGDALYVLFLDLDRFKEVNDTYGHAIGDKLLKKVSVRLQNVVPEAYIISRVSGDEFVIILKNIDKKETLEIVNRIINAIEQTFIITQIEIFISVSIGISNYPKDGNTAKVLLQQSDTAMYKAKEKGKNTYQFYDQSMTDKVREKQKLGHDLRKAFQNDEFEVYYQPKINVITHDILGLEALIRWNHPQKGFLSPKDFLEIAEEIGLIIKIDEYVRASVFKQIFAWQREGLKVGIVSLNLSTKQLESKSFLSRLHASIEDTGIDLSNVEFEVLENQIMKNINDVIPILESLKSMGINLSVDDFGTGYSSLGYLQKFPIDTLKIDRSFISDLENNEDSLEIVRTIIALAKNLDLDMIAEGVETEKQMKILIEEGCVNMQGYYFSKPLSASECKDFIINYGDK